MDKQDNDGSSTKKRAQRDIIVVQRSRVAPVETNMWFIHAASFGGSFLDLERHPASASAFINRWVRRSYRAAPRF
jgi:hypothetical protein